MIYEALKLIANDSKAPQIRLLPSIVDVIRPKVEEHLKIIESQLPNYDNHDISHCKKMNEIIESLVPDVSKLNPFELFLLYMSVLMHDTAMALPSWEYEILRMCEGHELYREIDLKNPFLFDGKKPLTFSAMKSLILKDAKSLLPTEAQYKNYVFALDSNEDLLDDLASRAIEYSCFRNGYTDNFDIFISSKDVEGYLKYSKHLRGEFIRRTHASRVEINAKSIYKFFDKETYGNTRKQLAGLLAQICKSHGEQSGFIWGLPSEEKITADTTSNIQFIAILLRLSDILHFSIDRASISHFVEKMIDDPISRIHWQSKFEGVTCSTMRKNELLQISMSAFCAEPRSYYFLHDYSKWIEEELLLYFKFYRNLKPTTDPHKYYIPFIEKVDTTGIKYDEDVFTPETNLKFTLDQKRIIELLMGVNLYKNGLMCLRELYQNSLDTCRYMTSVFNEDGLIEFGIESDIVDGKDTRYLYCLDNGMGMTREIIHNHFLKVGNSYYNSEDFKRSIVKTEKPFSPVSKFGIGLLSCFMLCERMDITTKVNDSNSATRFVIEGVHEHFYYAKPKRPDIEEKLGRHGTLIKLYLKDNVVINDDIISDEQTAACFIQSSRDYDHAVKDNLFYILHNLIKICPPRISVLINLSSTKQKIIPIHTEVTSFVNISFEDLVKISKDSSNIYITDEQISLTKSTKWMPVNMTDDSMGLDYRGVILFPPLQTKREIEYPGMLTIKIVTNNERNSRLLNDGIAVTYQGKSKFWSRFSGIRYSRLSLNPFSYINFYGKNRPLISVDRESIVSFDNFKYDDMELFLMHVAETELNSIINHFSELGLESTDKLIQQTWDIYFFGRGFLYLPLLKLVQLKIKFPIFLTSLSDIFGADRSLQDILNSSSIEVLSLNTSDFNSHNELFDCIFSRAKSFELIESRLLLKDSSMDYSMTENDFADVSDQIFSLDDNCYSYSAQGIYSEYHVISKFYPIVNDSIATCFNYNKRRINDTQLETNFVYPERYNLFGPLKAKQVFPDNVVCLDVYDVPLGEKDQVFSLYDQRFLMSYKNCVKSHILFYFIVPSDEKYDENALSKLSESNPEYLEGLLNGWSVLFLGATNEVVTHPGLIKLEDILLEVPDNFWDRYKMHQLFLNDNIISREYIEALKSKKLTVE